ncbi:MAG: DNA repair protein RadC [Alphaproteobacteria bacterium]|nr:DNA repair protein RadC [Alphaproteobacteria bacterium]
MIETEDKFLPIGHGSGGHRERLRQRFAKGGAAALADYELLEMLLFASNPRGDVKPLAKNLIKHFGSFAGVIAAPRKELLAVSGIGDVALTMIKLVEAAALELSKERVIKREVMSNWRALLDYCRSAMAYQRTEQFRILFLDNKNALIADEVQQTGTLNYAPVYPREIVKRCLELGASAIILLHNHPSGDPEPSKADIEMTHEIIEAVNVVGVAVHDHLIIGLSGHTSLKSLGVI